MPAKRKPPPEWWLLGYLAQYQPKLLLDTLEKSGIAPEDTYRAAHLTAQALPNNSYRRMAKAWAVRQSRYRTKSTSSK